MATKFTINGIATGQTIEASQVSQSVQAFTAADAYDIQVSGSVLLTGSFIQQSGSAENVTRIQLKQVADSTASAASPYTLPGSFGFVAIDSDGYLYSASAAAGSQGATGAQGTTGGTGTQGAVGAQGNTGGAGTQGATGANGTNGSQGGSGAQGTAGSAGTQGETGPVGPQGADGTAGTNGTQGATGINGPQGADGAKGEAGNAGTQGETGNTGAQGNTGPAGGAGTQGATGAGTQGATGTQGAGGTQGTDGTNGTQGATGAGTQGATGAQGADGTNGTQGETGSKGQKGEVGAGTQGATGAQGTDGTNGTNGTQGATGAKGQKGEVGVGTQGAIGTNGPQGAVGTQGNTGTQGTEGSGGASISYNSQVTYQAAVDGSNHEVHIVSTGNVYGGLTWARSSTTLTVTSAGHGLSVGEFVVIRNMSVDYSYLEIQSTADANTFTVTVPDSGGTSGTAGAYIPAVKAAVTGTSSVTAVTLTAPSAGNIRINVYQQYSSGQQDPMTLTIPTTLTNGNGFGDKQSIFPVTIEAIGTVGSGTSSGITPSLSYNLGTNINRISISNIDNTEADTNISIKF